MATHAGRLTGPHVGAGLRRIFRRPRDVPDHAVPDHPATHRLRPPLAARERMLLRERDLDGAPLVATTQALHHRPAGSEAWDRLPWEELGRVRWDRRLDVLDLTRYPHANPIRLWLPAGSRVPAVVRERVGATEILGARVPLHDLREAVVSIRRRPGSAGMVWVVLLPDGVNPDDIRVRSRVDGAMRELRIQLGLDPQSPQWTPS